MDRRQVLLLGAATLGASLAAPRILRASPNSGISDSEIMLGSVMPVTGPVRIASEPYELGIRSVFESVNDAGGINGRKLSWQVEDDAYQTNRAVAAAKKLVERDDVFMIFGQHGTPTGFAMAPYVEQMGVPMMMTTAGPSPLKKYVFGGLAPYSAIAYQLTNYLLKGKFKNVGLLYQNDELGEAGRLGIGKSMKENDAELGADVGFERTTTDFSSQVLKIRDSGADAVIVLASGPSFASIIKTANGLGVKPQWATYSVASIRSVRDLLGTAIDGIVYASEIDSPDSDEAGVVECGKLLEKYHPKVKLDWGSMLGYAHARLLVRALKEMGNDITRDGLVSTFEKMHGVETGTTSPMGFSPTNHNAPAALKIFQYELQKPVAKSDWLDVSNFTAE